MLPYTVSPGRTEVLRTLALNNSTTLYTLLLAIYNVFLFKLSGQTDIIVGTPLAARRHDDLQDIIGMFVNTLPLRSVVPEDEAFDGYLKQVRQIVMDAFENQEYPLERMVEQLDLAVDGDRSGRNPLFSAVFGLQNAPAPPVEVDGLRLTPVDMPVNEAKFDLTFNCFERDGALNFRIEYPVKLFREESLHRFIRYFDTLIDGVLESPGRLVRDLELMSAEEKQMVLETWNDTRADYPRESAITDLFRLCAAQTPDRVALVYGDYQLTFRQLDRWSDAILSRLKGHGAVPGTIVAMMLGRSQEMAAAMLGILKAGGIYMPIDPEYPDDRKHFMLQDGSVHLLIGPPDPELVSTPGFENLEIIDPGYPHISGDVLPAHVVRSTQYSPRLHPASLPCYVIYTSGSTGRPKGVLVTHGNVVRLIRNTNYTPISSESRILQTGAPVFDAATYETWGTLLNSGFLVLVDSPVLLDAFALGKELHRRQVNTLFITTSLFNQLLEQDIGAFGSLKYLMVGGDIMSTAHINRIRERFPRMHVSNIYGPTENTTFSTVFPITRRFDSPVPIGYPISNSTVYVVDKHFRPQPPAYGVNWWWAATVCRWVT